MDVFYLYIAIAIFSFLAILSIIILIKRRYNVKQIISKEIKEKTKLSSIFHNNKNNKKKMELKVINSTLENKDFSSFRNESTTKIDHLPIFKKLMENYNKINLQNSITLQIKHFDCKI